MNGYIYMAIHSPCPQCGHDDGSASSIPRVPLNTAKPARGGEVEPSKLIQDPVLRAAFMRAYQAWEKAQA